MSIHRQIAEAMSNGKLVEMAPVGGGPQLRRVIAIPDVVSELYGRFAWSAEEKAEMAGCVSKLEEFMVGRIFFASMQPFNKPRKIDLALTSPPEWGIFAIRVYERRPQFRLFGAFADKDCFILLCVRNREALLHYDDGVEDAHDLWVRLFSIRPPMMRKTIHDLASRCRQAV